jgi:hypothetical protein
MQEIENMPAPAIISVDDFDMHEIHVETHNKFRMSQEYEILPDEVKQQFAEHVAQHEAAIQQKDDGSDDDGYATARWVGRVALQHGSGCYDGT